MGRKGSDTSRGSTQLPRFERHRQKALIEQSISPYEKKRALATCNVVETCTLLAEYRLARGILFLLVGALTAAGASSLCTPGKGHVSRVCRIFAKFIIAYLTGYVKCRSIVPIP